MKIQKTSIEGVLELFPQVFEDERGHFFESFNSKKFSEDHDIQVEFCQDNHSISKKGVFRGLHFQAPPFDQDKLVRVVSGRAIDYIVDIRKSSKTYGQVLQIELDSDKKNMVLVPKGMAHGFLALEDNTQFLYKCSNFYHPESEQSILYSSVPNLELPTKTPLVNQKDLDATSFDSFISPF